MKKKYIILFVSIAVIIGSTTGYLANAQVETPKHYKVFLKDFCATENNLFEDIILSDGSRLTYSSTGCPISEKVIYNWNELTITQQQTITARLTTLGYVESVEIIDNGTETIEVTK